MDVALNAFASGVKYVDTKGFPLGVQRIDNKRVLFILSDAVYLVDAREMQNTINDVMGWDNGG